MLAKFRNKDLQSDRILSSSFELGSYCLTNRIVIAPKSGLLSCRNVFAPQVIDYYATRSSAGLIITEPTLISPTKKPSSCPGIYSRQQVQQWREVTAAVHNRGGKIFLQLHYLNNHHTLLPQKDSINARGNYHTQKLSTAEKEACRITELFRSAAQNALAADFDGIEIQIVFAYPTHLPRENHTSVKCCTTSQTEWLLSTIEEICSVWNENRVGIRISPEICLWKSKELELLEDSYLLLDALNFYDLAYLHLDTFTTSNGVDHSHSAKALPLYRSVYHGTIISSCIGSLDEAKATIANGNVDLISFTRLSID